MVKIGEGETAEVYKIDDNKVVKLYRNEAYAKEYSYEYEMVKIFGETVSNAPKVYNTIEIDGRTGYIMEEVKGELLQELINNKKESLVFYARLLGENHRLIHNSGKIEKLESVLSFKKDFPDFLEPDKDFNDGIIKWIRSLMESLPNDENLLHGDFLPYNIIVSNNECKVIDWAEPCFGPGIVDVARTVNCLLNPYLEPNAEYSKNSEIFIKNYLKSYFKGEKIDKDLFNKCLIIDATFQYQWAKQSNTLDPHFERLKEYVKNNYNEFKSDTLSISCCLCF